MISKTEQTRALNDALRQNFREDTAVMTIGVAALSAEAVARIVKTIAIYDDFCHANDPYEEHDFGCPIVLVLEADSALLNAISRLLAIATRWV
jgi:hypothetical protein